MIKNKLVKWLSLLLTCILGVSCSSDFEPHIMAEPTPVVYGIINPYDSLYNIRLTKSFIGPGNAYEYARVADSIYYSDARVFLESKNFSGKTLDRVELFPLEIEPRSPGIFTSSPNIVYQTDYKSIRLRPEMLSEDGIPYNIDLFLEISVPGRPELSTAMTRLKKEPRIINPKGNFQKVYFYGELPFYMEWTHDETDTYFEIKVVMRYREVLEEGEREAEVYWVLTGIEPNEVNFPGGTRTIYSYYFRPENFYSQIRAAVPKDPEVKGRVIRNLDFIILSSDGTIKEYNEVNQIADDYRGSSYSNILNGLGIFSAFIEKGVYNQRLGQRELDSLAFGIYTKHLNFKNWE